MAAHCTPCRQASEAFKLEFLPTDVLQNILGRCRGDDVLRLWISGAPVLCRKLATGGVRRIDLADSRDGTPSRWPHCLGEMTGLKEIEILRGEGRLFWALHDQRPWYQFMETQFKRLPSTLESLRITCQELMKTAKGRDFLEAPEIGLFSAWFPLFAVSWCFPTSPKALIPSQKVSSLSKSSCP